MSNIPPKQVILSNLVNLSQKCWHHHFELFSGPLSKPLATPMFPLQITNDLDFLPLTLPSINGHFINQTPMSEITHKHA